MLKRDGALIGAALQRRVSSPVDVRRSANITERISSPAARRRPAYPRISIVLMSRALTHRGSFEASPSYVAFVITMHPLTRTQARC